MPRHELDARFKFCHDSGDPGGLHNAVGVGKAENLALAGVDKLAEGVLLGTYPFGNLPDGQNVQPRVLGGVFLEDFRRIVVAPVVGDPHVPLPCIVLCENGIERRPDARRLVAGGNQHAYARFWFHVGLPEAHRTQRAVKTRLQGYVE